MPNRESWPGRAGFRRRRRVSPSLPTRKPRQTPVSGPPASEGTAEKDSPLEQRGFELPVPLASIRLIFAREKGLQVEQSGQNRPLLALHRLCAADNDPYTSLPVEIAGGDV
jgi:hypothetical protein